MGIVPELLSAGGALAASGIFAWGAVAPSSELFGATIRHTGSATTIALTFDDGPNPAATPQLLDLLDRNKAEATFFMIGERVTAAPNIAKEAGLRGHAIGNHTFAHTNLTFRPAARISEELARCDDAIESATGRKPRWMRPPFGYRGPMLGSVVRKRGGGGVVMWSRSARDWNPQPEANVIHRLHRVRGGDIVLLHDGDHRIPEADRRHTLKALEHWLPRWKDAGLRFVTLDEMVEGT